MISLAIEFYPKLSEIIFNTVVLKTFQISEPGLLEELARRVEAAEAKFESANLDLRLTELEAAKKRQVTHTFFLFNM